MIRRYCALYILLLVALLALRGHAHAAESARVLGAAPSVVVERHVRHYLVAADGTYRLTVDDTRTLAGPSGARDGRVVIRYRAALDEVVAVQAYTYKPDGRRIPVPPDGIRDQPDRVSAAARMPDARTRLVEFPDAAAGDRLVTHYVVRRHTPALPGQFDDLAIMPPYVHRNALVVYDMPATLPLHADAVGFEPVADANSGAASAPGRRRYAWRHVDGPVDPVEADAVASADHGRRLAVSTLPDYPALAAAARAAVAAREPPVSAVAPLALRLTAGLADPRARALALADWVRLGGAVPAAAAANAAGTHADGCHDCGGGSGSGDRAALLQALLAAAGIASTPALVNGANAYRLPDAPTLGVLDHTIVYMPSLDLFVDPSAAFVKAGYLPPALLGKPALLLATGSFAMTPVTQPQQVRSTVAVDLDHDGRGRFAGVRTVSGALAEPLRTMAATLAAAARVPGGSRNAALLREVGGRGGTPATSAPSGTTGGTAADGTGDDYRMPLSGSSGGFGDLARGGPVATTYPAWSAVDAALAGLLRERARRQEFVCPALDVADEIRLRLPAGLRFATLPAPASVISGGIFYQAAYVRDGAAALVTRRLTFRHGRATCTPDDARAMQPALERIRQDLRSRLTVAAGPAHGIARGMPAEASQRVPAGATGTAVLPSGRIGAGKRIAPPARAQRSDGLVRQVETQVDAVAARPVAGGPARDLDEAAAPEKAGRVRMRIDRHVAGPQLARGHVQQPVGQQRAADAGAVTVGAHEPEHERAEVVEVGQLVAAESDDLAGVDGDEQRTVRIVQRGAQPGFF